MIINLKSPWYYWYRDRKLVALLGTILGMGIMALLTSLTTGFGFFPLILMLFLDHILIIIAVFYLMLRIFLPDYLNPSFADGFLFKQFLFIVLPGILVVRISTLWVAFISSRKIVDFDQSGGLGAGQKSQDFHPWNRGRPFQGDGDAGKGRTPR